MVLKFRAFQKIQNYRKDLTLWQKFAIIAHSSQLTAHSLSCGLLTGKLRLLALLLAVFLLSFIVPQAQAVTITLHTNGGTIDTATTVKGWTWGESPTAGQSYTLTANSAPENAVDLPTTTRIGYTLEGWYTEETLTNKLDNNNIPANLTQDAGYWAKWTGNQYTITFNANAPEGKTATGEMADLLFTCGNDTAITGNAFAVEGYKFVGWSTTNNGPHNSDFTTGDAVVATLEIEPNEGKIPLYAQWMQIFTLTLNLDGGTLPTTGYPGVDGVTLTHEDESQTATITYDNDATAKSFNLPVLTKDTYTFKGWKDKNGTITEKSALESSESKVFPKEQDNEDATYTAVWTLDNVSYKDDSGTDATATTVTVLTQNSDWTNLGDEWYLVEGNVILDSDVVFTHDTSVNLILKDEATLTLTDKSITASEKTLNIYSQSITGDKIGKLTAQSITAGTLNLYGGNLTLTTLPTGATVKNATINGHAYSSEGKTTYTVIFNPNGGTFSDNSTESKTVTITVAYGSEADAKVTSATEGVPTTVPTKTGYTFAGWTLATADDVYDFATSNPVSDAKTELTLTEATTTLTAQWTQNEEETDDLPGEFSYHSLVLSGRIGVNFYAEIPTGYDTEGAYVSFTVGGATTTVGINAEKNYYQPTEGGTKYYAFECPITSIEMADEITAQLFCKKSATTGEDENPEQGSTGATVTGDGGTELVAEETDYTASTYLDTVITKNADDSFTDTTIKNDKLLALVNAMKDYGHYAQIPLQAYHSDTWVFSDADNTDDKTTHVRMDASAAEDNTAIYGNDFATETSGTVATVMKAVEGKAVKDGNANDSGATTGISKVEYTLVLDNETELELDLTTTDDVKTVSVKIDDGEAQTLTPTSNKVTVSTGGIPAHKLHRTRTFTITATKADESSLTAFMVKLSPYSYIYSVLDDSTKTHSSLPNYGNVGATDAENDLAKAVVALYHYCEATKDYITANNTKYADFDITDDEAEDSTEDPAEEEPATNP